MKTEYTTRIAAYGLLMRQEKLLLCRLSPQVGMHPGYWTLPGGGLDFGEDPKDAVVREFREETGLSVKIDQLVAVDSLCDTMPGWPPMHSIRIVYRVEYVSGELVYEQDGSTDLCDWHTQSAMLSLPLVALAKLGAKHAFASQRMK